MIVYVLVAWTSVSVGAMTGYCLIEGFRPSKK